MNYTDIRWEQRAQHYTKACKQLHEAIRRYSINRDDDIIQAGLIQIYEFTLELGWKTLKDYLAYNGSEFVIPNEIIRASFQAGYIQDAELWLQAIKDRNMSAHIYDESTANEIADRITTIYISILDNLEHFLTSKKNDNRGAA